MMNFLFITIHIVMRVDVVVAKNARFKNSINRTLNINNLNKYLLFSSNPSLQMVIRIKSTNYKLDFILSVKLHKIPAVPFYSHSLIILI